MAEPISLITSTDSTPADIDAVNGPVGDALVCDDQNRIRVSDIIDEINNNIQRLEDVEGDITIINNYAKIKTRRVGNVLYMTDDGSNP